MTTTTNGAITELPVAEVQLNLRQLGYTVPTEERSKGELGPRSQAALKEFQSDNGLPATGEIDAATSQLMTIVIGEHTYVVTGSVITPALPGVAGITVALVDKNVGGDVQLDTTQTASDGSFSFQHVISDPYLHEHQKTQADLQVQVMDEASVVASSDVQYSTPLTTTFNVTLPAGASVLLSEYETLAANVTQLYVGGLADLEESETRSDITYLANKGGWDARAIAMAALAAQFSQLAPPPPPPTPTPTPGPSPVPTPEPVADAAAPVLPIPGPPVPGPPIPGPPAPGPPNPPAPPVQAGIPPEFYYALFRAGVPANADAVFAIPPATVESIWTQAARQGVIPRSLAGEAPKVLETYRALSAGQLLTATGQVGLSTFKDVLGTVVADDSEQQTVARLYVQYAGNWADFWDAVGSTLGEQTAQQLRVAGQLSYLTFNNAPLVSRLQAAQNGAPMASVQELVDRGYYDAAAWKPVIGSDVPPAIPGSGDDQVENYAQLLAAQVRVAFPTGVLADQVRRELVPIADPSATDGVLSFFADQDSQFEIGLEPVEAYIARTGVTGTPAPVVAQIKRLQRVYQLSPDDGSMAFLLRHSLDSAYAITRYNAAGFTRAFGAQLGTETATSIHARARQIHTAVLSLAAEYLKRRSAPDLGGSVPVKYGLPPSDGAPSGYPVVAYATLEELFGSLDYCNCPDCRSILSPAAYLVDLLHYLDQPAPCGPSNPQDVLLERRPDLQYLPLTCANTNTALPYIDIVNETLEYYVANGLSLSGYQGHDTGDTVTTAELVAAPQYVDNAAYAILQDAFFPPPLPFNRPLTLLRSHLARLGISLADAMAALRPNDQLTNRTTPTSYGWSDILIEEVGISRDEYRLFTDSSVGLGALYGLDEATALTTLQRWSLEELSRRLGISYDEIAALLETEFINPRAALIPRLQRLNSSFATLQQLHDTLGTPQSIAATFIASLPAGLDATEYGGASPTDYHAVVEWVTGPQVYPEIMGLITISNPSGDASDCSGASLELRYTNPDSTQNLLSATDFLKLIRYIRLWQKLTSVLTPADSTSGIQDADHILGALYPTADLPADTADTTKDPVNFGLLDTGFKALLPRLGFLLRTMAALSLSGDDSLDQLLACWAPIPISGPSPLYARMFLAPGLLEQDPGAQTATVGVAVNAGDVLTTAINAPSVPQVSYTVAAGQDAVAAAGGVAAAINGCTETDPESGVPLNGRFAAVSNGRDVVIRAGFTLACAVSPGATETFTGATSSAVSHSATVGGTITAGDVMITTLDGLDVTYSVQAADTPVTVAEGIAAAINATTTPDPYSGLPLNVLVYAYVAPSTAIVELSVAGAGAPFTLACGFTPANAGDYTAQAPSAPVQTATVSGATATGDVLVTTLNQVPIPYTATATDTSPAALAASITTTINGTVTPDPSTGVPLSELLHATSAGAVVTIAALDPGMPFTLACAVTIGSESYLAAGPFPATGVTTVTGQIPAGAILTTTINGLPVLYTIAAGDTAASIASAIAGVINATAVPDITSGVPLNQLVSAASSAGTVTVTANLPTVAFTLAAAMSTGSYTAGRQPSPFADNGYGEFLADPTQTLFAHEPTLCAACNLTGADIALICDALRFTASTPLTLDAVSAVFRFGWLAHALGLSVTEFLLLRELTGLDPFAPLDPGSGGAPAEPPVIRLARLLSKVSDAGLTTGQVLYLIYNQDLSGTSAPQSSDINGLATALRAAFVAVDAAFTLQADPTGAVAQGLMTLVYGTSASDFFFGLLAGTLTTSAAYAGPPELTALPPAIVAAAAGRLTYDPLRLQLTFAGVLDGTTQAALTAAITVSTTDATDVPAGQGATFKPASMTNIWPGATLVIDTGPSQETVLVATTTATTFTADTANAHDGSGTPFAIVNGPALPAALGALAVANQQAVASFFAAYPELAALYMSYAASSAPAQAKRETLLAAFLPVLKAKRKQQQALASITAAAGSDPSFATTVLRDATILHSSGDATAPAAADLTAIDTDGLSAEFFLTNDTAAPPDDQVDSVPSLAYAQTATIGGTVAIGDVLTTTLGGVAIPFTVGAFALTCGVSPGATESYTAAVTSPVEQTATVAGPITAGDVLITTLDGVPVSYTVVADDTADAIAAAIATAINAAGMRPDATAAGAVVTVTVPPGAASDISLADVAGDVAAAINATSAVGPASVVPIAASAASNTIALAAGNPARTGGFFDLACSVSPGATLTYEAGTQLPTGAGDIAAVWRGYITAPQDGLYDLAVAADPGAAITLEVDEALVSLEQVGSVWTSDLPVSLVAGQLVSIRLTAQSLKTTFSVSWQSAGIGWQLIPGTYLYSQVLVDRLADTYVRFLKATSLAGALSLTAKEIAYLGVAPTFAIDTTMAAATAPGPVTFTPASMSNIAAGRVLVLDTGAAQEQIKVTAATATTFSAVTAQPHDGTNAPVPIVDQAYPEFGQGWLNFLLALPSAIGDSAALTMAQLAQSAPLAGVLTDMLDFALMKQPLSAKDDRLLSVLEDPGAILASGQSALLGLTGWPRDSLDALLRQFFTTTDRNSLSSVENLRRVYDAFALVRTSRLSAAGLIAAITNAPTPTTVSALESALRSGYAESDWLTAVKPINDAARQAQRDALVAYVVQQEGDAYQAALRSATTAADTTTGATQITLSAAAALSAGMSVAGSGLAVGAAITSVTGSTITISPATLAAIPSGTELVFAPAGAAEINSPDSFFQYLLIDPETEPPVLTSRMLLSVSAVQLFIERVTRGLEPTVSPSDIDIDQWTWMKRYRVWQANREVFLWPENWLYPELRDNQSPFFEQTMSALLQGDITDDSAESAYLDYLTSLEEVAKLEACGMYYQPATADADEVTTVVSRTAGGRRKHYFRQLTSGAWTPWSEVSIDCEDVPITPIVWNGRLFLFWLRIHKDAVPNAQIPTSIPSDTPFNGVEIGQIQGYAQTGTTVASQVAISAELCWSEYYNGKWQPTKTSDVNLPTSLSGLGLFDATGPGSFEQAMRGSLRLVPAQYTGANVLAQASGVEFTVPPDALIVAIVKDDLSGVESLFGNLPFAYGGFLLHNSHSIPVRLEDVLVETAWGGNPIWAFLDLPTPSRTLSASQSWPSGLTPPPPFAGAFGSGTFTAAYEKTLGYGATATNPILQFNWGPRFTQPQIGLPDAWDAPFIYEDRRHLFYVTTTEGIRTVWSFDGFGIWGGVQSIVSEQGSGLLLHDPVAVKPPPTAQPVVTAAADPASIQRYLSQQTALKAALASRTTVTYQERVISPTGSAPMPSQPASTSNGRGA